MKNKMILFGLMILILLICSSHVCAEDNLDNTTLTTFDEETDIVQQEDNDSNILSSSEITVTNDNYNNYFNKYTGKLKDDVDKNINTIKIANVSNKAFTIDRPLNIMPFSSNCEIKNGVIHLIGGSSGSNITNLVINNTKGELYIDGLFVSKLHGIWFSNSSDNLIFNNTIRIPGVEGCYAMPMGYSSRNRILYNDIVSTFTSCILMGLCDYNNISFNRFEILTIKSMVASNIIYCNCFGHADYNGPATCIGTYISNNYFKNSEINDQWEATINILGESNYTKIINNTVVNAGAGISVSDPWSDGIQANNVTIFGNRVINCSYSIVATTNDVIVANNTIFGSSMDVAISIGGGKHKDNASIFNNEIIFKNLYSGITLYSCANVFNNTIKLNNYGSGISIANDANNSYVVDNFIQVVGDNGINIFANNVTVSNNIIHTKGIGINSKIIESLKFKIYNNTIISNKIYSDKYGVYIEGYVYNTTIKDNYIETNESEVFYIDMYMTLNDKNPGKIEDNTINGVIRDTQILIVNDTNYHDYFDDEGYLKYDFGVNSHKILFLTFLSNKNLYFTDSITLTSNKQANLLYNVTITLKEDAYNSTIKDLNFYSFDKESIVLDGVENVVVKDNVFTTLSNNRFESKTISVIGGCNLCKIIDNDIFINSNSEFTYAIYISEPSYSLKKKFSHNFSISNNNILIKSDGVAEAMYFDALVESEIIKNNINIMSDGSAYGIAICDVMGRPYGIDINSNKVIINSQEMSYLIELYKVDNCNILNNYLKGTSNGIYAIGLYNSSSVIKGNEIIVVGKNITSNNPSDALGKGNSVVYLTKQSQIKEFMTNIIDSQNCEIITNSNIQKLTSNSYVISNNNYGLYFNSKGKLSGNIIKNGDTILFKNFTDSKTMNIDVSVTIKPYTYLNLFKANLILDDGSNKSSIFGFDFNEANIKLNNVSDIFIMLNNFTNSNLKDNNGVKNNILNNSFLFNLDNAEYITLNNCSNNVLMFNNIIMNCTLSKFVSIENSNQTSLVNNSFDIYGDSIKLITSTLSNCSILSDNTIYINASGDISAYHALKTKNDEIIYNNIFINDLFGNPTAIYYKDSLNNEIRNNRITSYSILGQDYAIVIESINNTVINNYLISSNGFKKGDGAVNANNNLVRDNIPANIYVSINASENGNGTFENPYSSIKKAIENCVSGAIIHILPGMYNESNIVVDKNITLTAINLEGNTYINALNSQLFKIKSNGTLTVNVLKIFNGFSVEGGSLFDNEGTLMINNSLIYNSSSYYNNSNPTFKVVNKYQPSLTNSYDCSNLGVGGAILNHGELIINSSTLYDNFAHKGGVIADFGKTTIKNSLICNNTGVHGGAIYTDSNKELIVENSEFKNNLAIQTLDHCFIQRIEYPEEAHTRFRYSYSSKCEFLSGMGGAIFSNTPLNIDNSLFDNNVAKYGGAIAYDSDILTRSYAIGVIGIEPKESPIKFSSNSILKIKNSIFSNNAAQNTSCGNLSMLIDESFSGTIHNTHPNGGAIFGALNEFTVYNTTFNNNVAENNGGALCVQSYNSSIEASKFLNNLAGGNGGALDLFGNLNIFNTEIINNSAKYGGAIQYKSFVSYGRIQNNMAMFNVTVAKNKALLSGGAFSLAVTNFAIKNSNIYNNEAPRGSTFSGGESVIDARGNWWGSIDGPDNSVYQQKNIKFRTWLGQKVDWGRISIMHSNNNDNGPNNGNPGKYPTLSDVSTGLGVHTGSTLSVDSSSSIHGSGGFNFNGNWPNGNNKGNNDGNGIGNGVNPFISSGDSKTNAKGNIVNHNSLSKTNSSSVNNLASVGVTANAADSSTSSQSSSSQGSNGEDGKAYEIKKEIKKEIIDSEDLSILNILFILLWIFLFMGFYRKYCEEN